MPTSLSPPPQIPCDIRPHKLAQVGLLACLSNTKTRPTKPPQAMSCDPQRVCGLVCIACPTGLSLHLFLSVSLVRVVAKP